MQCYRLTNRSKNRFSDGLFLARVPLMPNKYLLEQGYSLGLMQAGPEEPLLLITDADAFWNRFQNYYQERFELEQMPEDYVVPASYEVVYGAIKFDNEEEAEAADTGDAVS